MQLKEIQVYKNITYVTMGIFQYRFKVLNYNKKLKLIKTCKEWRSAYEVLQDTWIGP